MSSRGLITGPVIFLILSGLPFNFQSIEDDEIMGHVYALHLQRPVLHVSAISIPSPTGNVEYGFEDLEVGIDILARDNKQPRKPPARLKSPKVLILTEQELVPTETTEIDHLEKPTSTTTSTISTVHSGLNRAFSSKARQRKNDWKREAEPDPSAKPEPTPDPDVAEKIVIGMLDGIIKGVEEHGGHKGHSIERDGDNFLAVSAAQKAGDTPCPPFTFIGRFFPRKLQTFCESFQAKMRKRRVSTGDQDSGSTGILYLGSAMEMKPEIITEQLEPATRRRRFHFDISQFKFHQFSSRFPKPYRYPPPPAQFSHDNTPTSTSNTNDDNAIHFRVVLVSVLLGSFIISFVIACLNRFITNRRRKHNFLKHYSRRYHPKTPEGLERDIGYLSPIIGTIPTTSVAEFTKFELTEADLQLLSDNESKGNVLIPMTTQVSSNPLENAKDNMPPTVSPEMSAVNNSMDRADDAKSAIANDVSKLNISTSGFCQDIVRSPNGDPDAARVFLLPTVPAADNTTYKNTETARSASGSDTLDARRVAKLRNVARRAKLPDNVMVETPETPKKVNVQKPMQVVSNSPGRGIYNLLEGHEASVLLGGGMGRASTFGYNCRRMLGGDLGIIIARDSKTFDGINSKYSLVDKVSVAPHFETPSARSLNMLVTTGTGRRHHCRSRTVARRMADKIRPEGVSRIDFFEKAGVNETEDESVRQIQREVMHVKGAAEGAEADHVD